jgi:hypothetical protein
MARIITRAPLYTRNTRGVGNARGDRYARVGTDALVRPRAAGRELLTCPQNNIRNFETRHPKSATALVPTAKRASKNSSTRAKISGAFFDS